MLLSSCDHLDKCKEKENISAGTNDHRDADKKHSGELKKDELLELNSSLVDSIANINNGCSKNNEEPDQDKCFLCIKTADRHCKNCLLPYCGEAHYALHTTSIEDSNSDGSKVHYCFPFRVLERPEVRIR